MCLALAATTVRAAHGAPAHQVRVKTFATVMNDHHGSGRTELWITGAPGVDRLGWRELRRSCLCGSDGMDRCLARRRPAGAHRTARRGLAVRVGCTGDERIGSRGPGDPPARDQLIATSRAELSKFYGTTIPTCWLPGSTCLSSGSTRDSSAARCRPISPGEATGSIRPCTRPASPTARSTRPAGSDRKTLRICTIAGSESPKAVARASARADGLEPAELLAGGLRLRSTVAGLRPKVVAVLGIAAALVIHG